MGSETCRIRDCGPCDRVADRLIHQLNDLVNVGFSNDQRRRKGDEVRTLANEQPLADGSTITATVGKPVFYDKAGERRDG